MFFLVRHARLGAPFEKRRIVFGDVDGVRAANDDPRRDIERSAMMPKMAERMM
jgi:hypothetical protein